MRRLPGSSGRITATQRRGRELHALAGVGRRRPALPSASQGRRQVGGARSQAGAGQGGGARSVLAARCQLLVNHHNLDLRLGLGGTRGRVGRGGGESGGRMPEQEGRRVGRRRGAPATRQLHPPTWSLCTSVSSRRALVCGSGARAGAAVLRQPGAVGPCRQRARRGGALAPGCSGRAPTSAACSSRRMHGRGQPASCPFCLTAVHTQPPASARPDLGGSQAEGGVRQDEGPDLRRGGRSAREVPSQAGGAAAAAATAAGGSSSSRSTTRTAAAA